VKKLNETKLAAGIYYIVGGIQDNEGCVIERHSNGIHAYYELNETTWFLVQTNYDRNLPDPSGDQRRTPAENRLTQIGEQNITKETLFKQVMTQYPNLWSDTILTSIMSARDNYINTTLWY